MPRGGSRKHKPDCQCGHCPKVGRKKLKPESDLADGNKDFATRVLARVGEKDWLEYADVRNVKNDEDYALHLMAEASLHGKFGTEQFNKLLDRKFGRSVQQIRVANPEGKKFQVEHSIDVEGLREKLLAALGG